jgi:hypothetical protein
VVAGSDSLLEDLLRAVEKDHEEIGHVLAQYVAIDPLEGRARDDRSLRAHLHVNHELTNVAEPRPPLFVVERVAR